MPASIPIAAQLAASAIASSVGLGGLATSAIVAGAGLLGSYVSSKMIGRDANSYLDVLASMKLNTSTTQRTIPLIYGEHKVGSNDVFIEVSEANKDLFVIVHCLGEGECEGISTDKNGVDQVFINDKLASSYKQDYVQYWFYSGTNTQAVSPAMGLATNYKFTDPMRNTSYMVFVIRNDKKLFSGVPARTVVVKGLKIYDFRTSVTAWSQNPVLVLYDYLTNTRYGLGWGPDLFDTGPGSSWNSAADYCDIDDPCSGKPKYYIDYYIGSQLKAQSIIETILSHFRGVLSWFGGSLRLYYSDLRYEAPIFSITDNDIARDRSKKDMISVTQPSSFGTPDGLVVKYFNKRRNWTLDDIPVGEATGNTQPVMFNAFSDRGLAYSLGLYTLERNRLNKTINVSLRPSLVEIDINDVGILQSSELALENQIVRVRESTITPDGLVNLTLILEAYELYDSVYNKDLSSVYEVNLPSIYDTPGAIWNIVFTEENYYNQNTLFTRLRVAFDPPYDYSWFDYVIVYYKIDDETEWKVLFNASDDFSISPVSRGSLYWFKFVSVNTIGITQSDEEAAYAQYQIGKDLVVTRPPSPTGVKLVGNQFVIEGVEPGDGIFFEIRIGTTLVGENSYFGESMTVSFDVSPNNVIPANCVRPSNTLGGYNIWAATFIENDEAEPVYCSTPYSSYSYNEIEISRFSTYIGTHAISYTTGTHNGTQAVDTGGGVYALRLIKTGGDPIFWGRYTSAEYYTTWTGFNPTRIYCDYTVSREATPNRTWAGVAPVGYTWDDCFGGHTEWEPRTWNVSTVNSEKKAGVEISFLVSNTSGGPYTEYKSCESRYMYTRFKYYKVQIDITDVSFGYRTYVTPMNTYFNYN